MSIMKNKLTFIKLPCSLLEQSCSQSTQKYFVIISRSKYLSFVTQSKFTQTK